MTPEQRAMADQRYKAMLELQEAMPKGAVEPRFAIFVAKRRQDVKADFRPLQKIRMAEWKEQGFNDEAALASYLESKFGAGRYLIEPLDEHNQRITKLPSWCVATSTFEDDDTMDDEDFEDDRPRRRRGRDDDFDDEDPRDRHSMADALLAGQKAERNALSQAMQGSNSMMAMIMLMNQQTQDRSREEALRREEMQRREDEKRRQEDQRRFEDERARREEERRLAEERVRREEERRAEERRRDEERRADERRRDEERREEERRRADERMKLLLGLVPTLIPVVERIVRPPEKKNEPDAITAMITKSFLESTREKGGDTAAIQMIVEATKAGSQLQMEGVKNAMQMQGELTKAVIAKAVEMMNEGGGEGNGGTMDKVMKIVEIASTAVSKLATPAPAIPARYQQRVAHRPVAPAAPTSQAAPAPHAAAPQAAPQAAPAPAQPVAEQGVTQEDEARMQEAIRQNPTIAVLYALMAVQRQQYTTPAEHQQLLTYALNHMSLDLRVAILDGDQERVTSLCMPTIQADQQLSAWVMSDGVLAWLQQTVPQLVPSIEALFGPADQQREQFIQALHGAQAAQAGEWRAQEPAAPTLAAAPAPAPEPTPSAEPAPAAEPIPGPGSAAEPPAAAPTGSHLDGETDV